MVDIEGMIFGYNVFRYDAVPDVSVESVVNISTLVISQLKIKDKLVYTIRTLILLTVVLVSALKLTWFSTPTFCISYNHPFRPYL